MTGVCLIALVAPAWTTVASAADFSTCQGAGSAGGSPAQKQSYCSAARSTDEGSSATDILSKVWTGVATVCAVSCATTLAGNPTANEVCKSTNKAGSATDVAMTHEYTSLLGSIFMSGGGQDKAAAAVASGDSAPAAEKPPEKSKEDWKAACGAAVMAGQKALSNGKASAAAEDATRTNLENARKTDTTRPDAFPAIDPTSRALAQGGGAQVGSSAAVAGSLGSDDGDAGPCSRARRGGDVAGMLECAYRHDPTIPPTVITPQFAKDFKRATGKSFAAHLMEPGGGAPPGQQVAQAMVAPFSGAQAAKVAELVAGLDRATGTELAAGDAIYRGGGGGSAGGHPESEPDFSQMMAGLLAQFGPKDPRAPGTPSGVYAVAAAVKARGPAAIAEDKTLSLFDRVSYRYLWVAHVRAPAGSRSNPGGNHP
jgi:hypothetical protein